MRLIALLLLLALVLAACDTNVDADGDQPPTAVVITSTPTASDGGSAPATGTPTIPASATEATSGEPSTTEASLEPTATAEPGSPDETPQSETVAEIEAIEADVAQLRDLDLVEDLNEEIIDRAELESRVEDLIEYSPEQARKDAMAYWLLGLIDDRGIDLFQLQVDLLGEQIAGYYNPESDDLVVVTESGSLSPIDKVTMAHEIVHALQDQHFDLVALDQQAIDTDHDMAITSLVEGDATFSMSQYMLEYMDPFELLEILGESIVGPQDFEVLDNAPRYIADQLTFPYEGGQEFVTALYDSGGFAAVDAALEDPPVSSEQILHPEKYLAADRDDPVAVENPDIQSALGGDWAVLIGNVLGEWDLRIMLEENGVAADQAATAASGWGGSRYDVYQSGEDGLVLLTTRWDSEDDAAEFNDALAQSFSAMQDDGGLKTDGERYFSTQLAGDTVLFISGTDRAAVEAAAGAVG